MKRYDKEQMISLYNDGYSTKRIAEIMGASDTSIIRSALRRYGIKVEPVQWKWTAEQKLIVKSMYEDRQTLNAIASVIGCNRDQVKVLVAKEGYVRPPKVDMYLEIKKAYKKGSSISDIAILWGMDEDAMRHWMIDKGIIKVPALKPKVKKKRQVKEKLPTYDIGSYKTCGECKKQMYRWVWDHYAYRMDYKEKRYVFCSYSCMRAFQKAHESKKEKDRWQYSN